MNPNIEFQWRNFVDSYLQKAPKSDVWSQTITQLDLQKISDGVAYFLCPNAGVKTVALNKQAQLVAIVSGITQTPVFSIFCEVVRSQKTDKRKRSEDLPPLLKYQPTLDDVAQQVGLNSKYSFDNFAVYDTPRQRALDHNGLAIFKSSNTHSAIAGLIKLRTLPLQRLYC
jgi:chromosomal replication initiation ATPase DnaA